MQGKTFVLTDEHIALLRAAYIRWEDCEYGAPAIDCKRPYGNSAVEEDILEVLGWEPEGTDEFGDPAPAPEQEERAQRLHRETETALAIVLETGSFVPGTYRQSVPYSLRGWEKGG